MAKNETQWRAPKITDAGVAIYAGTPQWDAWLAFHGNSKEAARMLGCLAKEPAVYAAPSQWPPRRDLPSLRAALGPLVAPIPKLPAAKPYRPARSIDEVAARLEKHAARDVLEREAHERASAPLRRMKKRLRVAGIAPDQAPATPTAERALKAGAQLRQDAVRAYHCEDSPIERLAARRAFDPSNGGRNEALRQAAARYYEHWYLSGMSPIKAVDLNCGDANSGARTAGMPATELALHHRRKYREALASLLKGGEEFSVVVDLVVLQEYDIEEAGYAVSRYRDRNKVIAVAMDRLCCGLERLRVHFRIGLDTIRTTMPTSGQGSQSESGGRRSWAMSRHRSLAGM